MNKEQQQEVAGLLEGNTIIYKAYADNEEYKDRYDNCISGIARVNENSINSGFIAVDILNSDNNNIIESIALNLENMKDCSSFYEFTWEWSNEDVTGRTIVEVFKNK